MKKNNFLSSIILCLTGLIVFFLGKYSIAPGISVQLGVEKYIILMLFCVLSLAYFFSKDDIA